MYTANSSILHGIEETDGILASVIPNKLNFKKNLNFLKTRLL